MGGILIACVLQLLACLTWAALSSGAVAALLLAAAAVPFIYCHRLLFFATVETVKQLRVLWRTRSQPNKVAALVAQRRQLVTRCRELLPEVLSEEAMAMFRAVQPFSAPLSYFADARVELSDIFACWSGNEAYACPYAKGPLKWWAAKKAAQAEAAVGKPKKAKEK
eukprot:PLAT3945.1.p2 GENE.PLAT3945.1~~PLAT3945.1.p2  ORF type:complete len:173 (+),score=47.98 PLAT3945.1:24-521(+)